MSLIKILEAVYLYYSTSS